LAGVRRWLRYRLIIPVFRSRHSPEYTARGVANGVFWGLTPTVGLQTFEIVATWFLARKALRADSSLVQALIWVWVNNPLTMVPMYFTFYLTGLWLTGQTGLGYESFASLVNGEGPWSDRVVTMAAAVGVPTLIGCVPFAVVGGALSYRWALAVVRRRRLRIHAQAL
jgi:uncharacterized protein (DUF2062 family)